MLTQRPSAQGANRAPAAKTQPQCPPRCTVVASTSGRQQAPEAQGQVRLDPCSCSPCMHHVHLSRRCTTLRHRLQASMARRHLLGLPVLLLPIISASPARAEIPPKLPGNAVPGATPIPVRHAASTPHHTTPPCVLHPCTMRQPSHSLPPSKRHASPMLQPPQALPKSHHNPLKLSALANTAAQHGHGRT